jgi:hypothetical protein
LYKKKKRKERERERERELARNLYFDLKAVETRARDSSARTAGSYLEARSPKDLRQ